jgi:hypothetical protein
MIIRRVFCWYLILMCTPKMGDNFSDRKLGTKMVRNRVSDFLSHPWRECDQQTLRGTKHDWLVVSWILFLIYGMWSVPLTNSYFSRWLKPPSRITMITCIVLLVPYVLEFIYIFLFICINYDVFFHGRPKRVGRASCHRAWRCHHFKGRGPWQLQFTQEEWIQARA